MIKSILSKHLKVSRAFFCTKLDIFPDQIVDSLKSNINKKDFDKVQGDIEVDIINNIHFFDADQFVDIFVLLAQNDRGSQKLWELLSRKIYDYELNAAQNLHIMNSLSNTHKASADITTHVIGPYMKSVASKQQPHNLFEKVLY
jgi:hypothetical protein